MILTRSDVNKVNADGRNALYVAAENGNADAVRVLIKYNADVTKLEKESNFSCLHAAALGTNTEVLMILIDIGADIGALDKDQRSMLHIAAVKCSGQIIRHPNIWNSGKLLESRDKFKSTPLHVAALNGNEDFARALLQAGVDFNTKDGNNRTPLAVAASDGLKKLLKEIGADGWTLLMMAAEQGGERFDRFLRAANCVTLMLQNQEFPDWFQTAVRLHASLVTEPCWSWGPMEPRNLRISDDKRVITKMSDRPDYSCVLGDQVLEEGIHRWEVKVDNVTSMWMGVARGVEEYELLGNYPPSGNDSGVSIFLLAFSSRGEEPEIFNGRNIKFEYPARSNGSRNNSYSSGQRVEFELNTLTHTLKMKVDGVLVSIALGVDDIGLRPYFCMDYSESLTLLSSNSATTLNTEHSEGQWRSSHGDLATSIDGSLVKKKDSDSAAQLRSSPSCALGNILSNGGIHKWKVTVRNVRDMWIGIAQGDEERLWHTVPRDCSPGDNILAFHCRGEHFDSFGCKAVRTFTDSGTGFSSGQCLELELNIFENYLKVRVDGTLALLATGLDGQDLRPYVCIVSSESARLVSVSSKELVALPSLATWRWGAREQNLEVQSVSNEEIEIVLKVEDYTNFASVLGSEVLLQGIHKWELHVDNVNSLWVGIARNIEENKLLGSSPYDLKGNDVYVLAFHSSGDETIIHSTDQPKPLIDGRSGFTSNQVVELELNTLHHTLKVFIDGKLELVATRVDDRAVRPYVCMGHLESVRLGARSSQLRSWRQSRISHDDWKVSFNNELWREVNEDLIKNILAGSCRVSTANFEFKFVSLLTLLLWQTKSQIIPKWM
jgi:hypothetical protein